MKTAIIYTTKYGSTEKVAMLIAEKLKYPADLLNVNDQLGYPVEEYDAIILGIPVFAESTTIHMRRFLKKHLKDIAGKIIGVFILCWNYDRWEEYLHKLVQAELPDSCITACFGGDLQFSKMMEIEKNIINQLTGLTTSESTVSLSEIQIFADKLNA